MRIKETLWKLGTPIACLLAGVFGHWKVFENDFFWQIRSGEEILKSGSFPYVDTWSSTAAGATWHNFQWLSSLVMYAVAQIQSDFALVPSFRAILIATLAWEVTRLIYHCCKTPIRSLHAWILIFPATFLISYGRLQMRPDLFGIVLFARLLNWIWSDSKPKHLETKIILLLVLSSGFHAGTAPISIGLAITAILAGVIPSRHPIRYGLAFVVTWFLGPNGWHVIQSVFDIAIRYDWTLIGNQDHSPITFSHLLPQGSGIIFIPWLILVSVALAFTTLKPSSFETPSKRKWMLLYGLALIALTFARMRARPYSILFWIPALCTLSSTELPRTWERIKQSLWPIASGAVALLLILYLVKGPRIGFGIDTHAFPVASARFLKTSGIQGRMLNAYDFGGYLVDQLRSLPVSQDGRETIFSDFFEKLTTASMNPSSFATFLERESYTIALVRAPHFSSAPPSPDRYALWYPEEKWALVFQDNASMVYIKRIPIHATLISKNEYKWIKRSRPISQTEITSLKSQHIPEARLELDRCLSSVPDNLYCMLYGAALEDFLGNKDKANMLRVQAGEIDPYSSFSLSESSSEDTPSFFKR